MKKFYELAFAFLCAFSCIFTNAEVKKSNGYTISLKASKDGSEYKKGEVAEFVLSVAKDGAPVKENWAIDGEITKDSVFIGKTFKGNLKDGKFSVSGTLNEAGFLKCKVFVNIPQPDGKSKRIDMLAGAAFDPLEIKPSAPAPEDFDAYWEKQKSILASIPMNVKLTQIPSNKENVLLFDVQADSLNGKLSAYMALPKDAKDKSLPAYVSAQGAGVRSSGRGVVSLAERGYIALDFNAHGLPNGRPAEFYKKLADGELKNYRISGGEDRDKVFFRTLYMRLMRAMDVVMAQPQWNGKDLMVIGGSQGGGQALAAAGLYPDKVTVCVAMFPAICDHTGPMAGRTSGWPHYTNLNKAGEFDAEKIKGARYIDAVNFASRIKCRTFFMINYADNVCEPTSCYAAYNAIKAPKSLYVNEQSRHAPAKGSYAALSKQARDYLEKSKK